MSDVVKLPKGAYSELRIELESGRVMVLVLPEGLSASEAAQVVRELAGLQDVVAGWQPS